jgi:hypothetical protein
MNINYLTTLLVVILMPPHLVDRATPDWSAEYMTRFAQPHVLTNMLCPFVISTLYQLLEEYK